MPKQPIVPRTACTARNYLTPNGGEDEKPRLHRVLEIKTISIQLRSLSL